MLWNQFQTCVNQNIEVWSSGRGMAIAIISSCYANANANGDGLGNYLIQIFSNFGNRVAILSLRLLGGEYWSLPKQPISTREKHHLPAWYGLIYKFQSHSDLKLFRVTFIVTCVFNNFLIIPTSETLWQCTRCKKLYLVNTKHCKNIVGKSCVSIVRVEIFLKWG